MSQEKYDLVVIGAGPGGYVAAIRAGQLGLKVACIEKEKALGGTCLNVGCIPSKALLESSEHYHLAQSEFAEHGILTDVTLNLGKMMERKSKIVSGLTDGIRGLFKKNKVDSYYGLGKVVDANTVQVTDADGNSQTLNTEKILLATGSTPVDIPAFPIDERRIVSSTGALALPEVPKHLVVIGGGVIGLELGSVWKKLGSEVTVIEFQDRVLPPMDADLSKQMQQILKKEKYNLHLQTAVQSVSYLDDNTLKVVAEGKKGAVEIECDVVLVSVGRRPFSDGLGLDEAGVVRNDRGFVEVDHNYQTNVPGIYAIGDLIPGPMLAHKAEEDGVACVERMCNIAAHVDYNLVPGVVYTHPEVASVGLTEAQVKESGRAYKVGKFPFMASGRARTLNDTRGFVKILADKESDQVLGVHMIGPKVSELIAEVVLAMEFHASAEDIARTCHAHPTLSESVKEAALAVDGNALHM